MSEITQHDLTKKLVAGEPVTILDIREGDEFEDWCIHGSTNLPLYTAISSGDYPAVDEMLKSASLEKGQPVVAVCRTGQTSQVAARALQSMGFEAMSLIGGIRGWSNAWTEAAVPLDEATLIQIRRNGKGCLSYVLVSNGDAAVIDPCVDVEVYTSIAEREGAKISHVLETHVHADHVSRARALAEATGAKLCIKKNDRAQYDYHAFNDGDTVTLGDIDITVIATPGHTGESVTYDVAGKALLTGDTVFADSIGRPDLEKGNEGAAAGAALLYDSLHNRILTLADTAIVCPGHTSEMIGFDGNPITSTLGNIKPAVELLKLDKDTFVKKVTDLLGPKPPNFERVISVNEGKTDLGWLDPLELEAGPNRCAVK
jgi:glyoxylase-like metal-dependent hydrolase (beta-lactamase superfamily II)